VLDERSVNEAPERFELRARHVREPEAEEHHVVPLQHRRPSVFPRTRPLAVRRQAYAQQVSAYIAWLAERSEADGGLRVPRARDSPRGISSAI
jgi:hypothetical protein